MTACRIFPDTIGSTENWGFRGSCVGLGFHTGDLNFWGLAFLGWGRLFSTVRFWGYVFISRVLIVTNFVYIYSKSQLRWVHQTKLIGHWSACNIFKRVSGSLYRIPTNWNFTFMLRKSISRIRVTSDYQFIQVPNWQLNDLKELGFLYQSSNCTCKCSFSSCYHGDGL